MKKKATSLGYLFLMLFVLPYLTAYAQNVSSLDKLKFQDRIVFLGNSIFENEVPIGYLEYVLTTQYPEKQLTFRNIGWSGDNVHGDARSYFTNPPTAYDLLIQQITESKPKLVFIAYGGIESEEGEAGLPKFNKGLNHLIDVIEKLGADVILLSTLPILGGEVDYVNQRNKDLQRYNQEIQQIGKARGKSYLDIYSPIASHAKEAKLSDNGFHLNELGYYYLGASLEKALGFPTRTQKTTLAVTKEGLTTNQAGVKSGPSTPNSYSFSMAAKVLPMPVVANIPNDAVAHDVIQITGLKKGFYTLSVGNDQIVTASAKEWADGVRILSSPDLNEAANILHMITKKNDLFFQQYRPLNRTYIIGFRLYEQGRHKQGLEDLNFIITWLEGQIAVSTVPKVRTYQLTRVQ